MFFSIVLVFKNYEEQFFEGNGEKFDKEKFCLVSEKCIDGVTDLFRNYI